MDLKTVSAVLITKDKIYPPEVMAHVSGFPFGEILVLTHSDSPYRKHELITKAKHDWIYYQDDDCIAPIKELAEQSEEGIITCAMKAHHLRVYGNSRVALLGWGSLFPKHFARSLDRYIAKYGEDFLLKRESERIMTFVNYPQKRLNLPIRDLPSALASDRLSMQPSHYDYAREVEQRLLTLDY